jgi:hypothetical protein
MKEHVAHVAFNRGLLSKYGLSRVDLKRASLSAEIMTNWMPRALGSMMLRPGLGYIGTVLNNAVAIHIPFIFATSDTALLELTDSVMRVRVNDALVSRPAVTTTVAETTFATLVSWTDIDELGAVSDNTGGKLNLTGTGYNSAGRQQLVTVPAPSLNVQHALRIVVERGPVTFRCGSTSGGDEYVEETELKAGTHSLTFTPTGNFYVEFTSVDRAVKLVTSITVEGAGIFTLPTPWVQADLSLLRWDQSGDVVFVACADKRPRRIERRDGNSWSLVEYAPKNGPFKTENITPIAIRPSAQAGNITLTSTRKFFKADHVGALMQLTSNGQVVTQLLAGQDQFTDPIRVTGVGEQARQYITTVSGTWMGRLTLQRSHDDGVTWTEFFFWTANVGPGQVEAEPLDNETVLLRIGFIAADYVSGSAQVTISNKAGGITGVARITSFVSQTVVNAEVLVPLGGRDGTTLWSEGAWSDREGFPTAVALFDGRLCFAGKAEFWASESDAFEGFDDTEDGDAGPINRTIGRGPVDTINWMLPLDQLVLGAEGAEIPVRATTQDEPITNTALKLKSTSDVGSAAVAAIKINEIGFFVDLSGAQLMRLDRNENGNYVAESQSQLIYDTVFPGIVRLAVQRRPDTRVHCVLDDGTVGVLVYDKVEEVAAWLLIETDGIVEDVVVLPGTKEDQVYYLVNRTIDGDTVRNLEKWAREDECRGTSLNKQADSFVLYSGAATLTVTGLTHLEGEAVVVWADGTDRSPEDDDGVQLTYTVTAGSITVTSGAAFTSAVIGLPYRARWKSAKLAYGSGMGSALNQPKHITQLGLVLANTHARGLKYGQDFDHLETMPLVEDMAEVDADAIHSAYDKDSIPLNHTWDTDSRLCLEAHAPRPCNVLSALMVLDEHDKG